MMKKEGESPEVKLREGEGGSRKRGERKEVRKMEWTNEARQAPRHEGEDKEEKSNKLIIREKNNSLCSKCKNKPAANPANRQHSLAGVDAA